MAKKNFFNTTSRVVGTLAMVLALVFGLVLAGCNPDGDGSPDPGPGPSGGVPTGTVTLAAGGTENTFTLTLAGGLTWLDQSSLYGNPNTGLGAKLRDQSGDGQLLAIDGSVTADGADANDPAIRSPGDISFNVARTSDTVLTVTIQQYIPSGAGVLVYWGSGALKLNPDAPTGSNEYNAYSWDSLIAYTVQGSGKSNLDTNGKLTPVLSGTVNFSIPKYTS